MSASAWAQKACDPTRSVNLGKTFSGELQLPPVRLRWTPVRS
jgi:hypothetical protein